VVSQPQVGAPCCYFVDEAGDAVLFDNKGRSIIGKQGCSRFFILGVLEVADPERLGLEMEDMRKRLLSDPYFHGVPSMQPEARKTALAFHATDDLPEVRREVFSLLLSQDLRFFAVIRDKASTLEYVRSRNKMDAAYRYNPNELYDYLVRCLFKERLHKHASYRVTFARRGKSDRTEALRKALDTARSKFIEQRGVNREVSLEVVPDCPGNSHGLQAVDYFLWAFQRLCEQHDDRFVRLVWPKVGLVRDLDDTNVASYGVYYSQKKPLTSAAFFANRPGI